jgi:glycerophosphoryl diester phosphodiesterase
MEIFAHRGARAYAPENTLSAFQMIFRIYGQNKKNR